MNKRKKGIEQTSTGKLLINCIWYGPYADNKKWWSHYIGPIWYEKYNSVHALPYSIGPVGNRIGPIPSKLPSTNH